MVTEGMQSNTRIRTRPWTTTTSTDWWERVVMTEFQPSDWLDKFRMSKETFFYLCDKVRPRLARQDTSFRLALPVEKRVAVALWRLASNIEYRTISTLFGVGKSTVCRCVRDMCHAIVALMGPFYLRSPNEQELEESAQLFLTNWGFPHCVAAIATLHTAIITPSNHASDYANPGGWLSVLSQVQLLHLWITILLLAVSYVYDVLCVVFCLFFFSLFCFGSRLLLVPEVSSGMYVPASLEEQNQLISCRTRRFGLRLQRVVCHLLQHRPSWGKSSG